MDIKEEFESIFGVTVRPSLFDADDAEYQQLRQQIINSPKELYSTDSLPFEGVSLPSFEEFKRRDAIEEAKRQGIHLFYIKEYDGSKLVCYGIGYFRIDDCRFVVLKDSLFKTSKYFTELTNCISDREWKVAFINSFRLEDDVLCQYVQRSYHSASLAASYILGRKVSFREWKDEDGKSLDAYYPMYRTANIDEREDKTFPNYIAPVVQKLQPVKESVSSLISMIVESVLQSKKHVFYLKLYGICDASGYYEKEDGSFVVLKGSRFHKSVSPSLAYSLLGFTRARFIDTACIEDGNEYVVKEDTRCVSPSEASSYLQGKVASYVNWIDSEGKYLKDIYPERFVHAATNVNPVPSEQKPVVTGQLHVFFIKRDGTVGRNCDASGTYDPKTQKFTIRAGSVLALEMSTAFRYSAAGNVRRNFISKYCAKEGIGYRLRKDLICNSPSAAAALVMGSLANGWKVWKDVKGYSLDSIYRS